MYTSLGLFFILCVFLGCIVLVTIRVKYGNGLGTKLFVFEASGGLLGVITGFITGWNRLDPEFSLGSLAMTVPFCILSFFILHKWLLRKLKAQIHSIASSSSQLSMAVDQLSSIAEEQVAAVTAVMTTVDESNQSIQAAASSAEDVLAVAQDTSVRGKEGLNIIRELVTIMEGVANTEEFVDAVRSIADQSNLLAVNAAVEAARAKHEGRGFSVVATEIRTLSDESKRMSIKIRNALRRSAEGQRKLSITEGTLEELSRVADDTSDSAKRIVYSVREQAVGLDQIRSAVSAIKENSISTASASEQVFEAARLLDQTSTDLSTFVFGATRSWKPSDDATNVKDELMKKKHPKHRRVV